MEKRSGISKGSVTGRQPLLDRHTASAKLEQGPPARAARRAFASCTSAMSNPSGNQPIHQGEQVIGCAVSETATGALAVLTSGFLPQGAWAWRWKGRLRWFDGVGHCNSFMVLWFYALTWSQHELYDTHVTLPRYAKARAVHAYVCDGAIAEELQEVGPHPSARALMLWASFMTCRPGYVLVFASASAQAFATAVFGVVLPESVAQPPFSMNWLCCQAPLLRNSASFAATSACAIKFSTQIGVRTAVTAASARCRAMLSAGLPRWHARAGGPLPVARGASATRWRA